MIGGQFQTAGTDTIINQGTINADVSGRYHSFEGDVFTNQRTAQAAGGGQLNVSTYTQTSGSTILSGGTAERRPRLTFRAGSGSGSINAPVRNAGEIDPGGAGAGH